MTNYFEYAIPGTDVTGKVKVDMTMNGENGVILNIDTSDFRDNIGMCLQRLQRLRNSVE
ncbi:hypothetical protein LF599_07505 [Pseudodesulfovibrio thermohalotolerans]|uniref:hypothetical protein n=1 Tax=Pseudodesulfovibrio thermohalotolerans TaxID=2880651 RepID=UPI0022B9FDFA|nr:hypothetical protein [Pseudodesulfovibrio thermohalotolerans]WFS64001.1 hypothetical protein LF599_07505 [Pseudodesulfovibrio thermohalotolerans]